MKGLVKCFKLQQTRSSTRITSNDRHNTCHAKLSKCCGKSYPSSQLPFTLLLPAASCRLGASNVLADAFDWFQYQLHIHRMGVRRSYTRIFTAQTDAWRDERTDARTHGWMDGRIGGWLNERDAAGSRRQTTARCWKATTVFIQFSLNVANALKTFRLRARQKSKKKILETFNVVAAAAAAASGFVFPSSLSLHTLLALYFSCSSYFSFSSHFFYFFCLLETCKSWTETNT